MRSFRVFVDFYTFRLTINALIKLEIEGDWRMTLETVQETSFAP
jgi:hypothetical protein